MHHHTPGFLKAIGEARRLIEAHAPAITPERKLRVAVDCALKAHRAFKEHSSSRLPLSALHAIVRALSRGMSIQAILGTMLDRDDLCEAEMDASAPRSYLCDHCDLDPDSVSRSQPGARHDRDLRPPGWERPRSGVHLQRGGLSLVISQ